MGEKKCKWSLIIKMRNLFIRSPFNLCIFDKLLTIRKIHRGSSPGPLDYIINRMDESQSFYESEGRKPIISWVRKAKNEDEKQKKRTKSNVNHLCPPVVINKKFFVSRGDAKRMNGKGISINKKFGGKELLANGSHLLFSSFSLFPQTSKLKKTPFSTSKKKKFHQKKITTIITKRIL